jgi:hypothetical protein
MIGKDRGKIMPSYTIGPGFNDRPDLILLRLA